MSCTQLRVNHCNWWPKLYCSAQLKITKTDREKRWDNCYVLMLLVPIHTYTHRRPFWFNRCISRDGSIFVRTVNTLHSYTVIYDLLSIVDFFSRLCRKKDSFEIEIEVESMSRYLLLISLFFLFYVQATCKFKSWFTNWYKRYWNYTSCAITKFTRRLPSD